MLSEGGIKGEKKRGSILGMDEQREREKEGSSVCKCKAGSGAGEMRKHVTEAVVFGQAILLCTYSLHQ